ncbi:MAG: XdhC family protein [Bacteroidota bacterium]
MLDIFTQLDHWVHLKKEFALATVVKTWRSAPRVEGSSMAITGNQEIIGSVSGGCIEGAVMKEAFAVLDNGQPRRCSFGVSNEDAWSVGLTCGGQVEVIVEKFMAFDNEQGQAVWKGLKQAVEQNQGCVLVSSLAESSIEHALVFSDGRQLGMELNQELKEQALSAYQHRKNQLITHGEKEFFTTVFPTRDKLIIIGAAHISVDLVELANFFKFETIVIDPRKVFTDTHRFQNQPSAIHLDWPEEVLPQIDLDENTYAVVLSHDPKIDDPALEMLLNSNVAYIGALGSRKNQEKRRKRLSDAGFNEEQISRIHGPVGLDIGARHPKEIALSIISEMVAVKNRFD